MYLGEGLNNSAPLPVLTLIQISKCTSPARRNKGRIWTSLIVNCMSEFKTTRQKWKRQRDWVQQRSHVLSYPVYKTTRVHKQNANSPSLKTYRPLPPKGYPSSFPDCHYQLDNVFSGTSFPSVSCVQRESWCTCVIDNKGMSSRAVWGKAYT